MKISKIAVNPDEIFVENLDAVNVDANSKYLVSAEIIGIGGKPYSAYFGVVVLDKNDKEITRKIRWLNDFSSSDNRIKLVFKIPEKGTKLVPIFRVNHETPIKSNFHFESIDFKKVSISKVEDSIEEDYDLVTNYKISKTNELASDEELKLEKNLVWILAPPRSGTSWLGTQLLSHNTLSMNEPLIGLHIGMRQPSIREKIVRNFDLFKNEPDYFFSVQYSDTWKHFLRKLILNRIHVQFHNLSKKIIIKEPNGTMGSDILMQCLPNSKIIFLVRDGRDTIDSMLDSLKEDAWAVKAYGFTAIKEDKKREELKFSSMLWVRLIKVLQETFDNHNKDLRLHVRYESLRNNTTKELKKIYDFIGIRITDKELKKITEKFSFENIPSEMKGTGKVTRSASPGKWQENFNDEEKKVMEEIIGETLRKLGY